MNLADRFAKALRKKAERGFNGYPVATIAYYGPNDKVASKVAVGIVHAEDEDATELERWFSDNSDVRKDPIINEEVLTLVRQHGVKSIVMTGGIIGCPHEEGIDYAEGSVCPHCPFWANRDRWTGKIVRG